MKYENGWVVDIVLDQRIPEAVLVLTPNRRAFKEYMKNVFDYSLKEEEIAVTVTVAEEGEQELAYVVFDLETATLEVVVHESVHLAMRCLVGPGETLFVNDEIEEKLDTLTGEITEVIWSEIKNYKNK